QLAFDAGPLIDEQHHRVDGRLTKIDRQRRAVVLAVQLVHLFDHQLETFDLHAGPREAVEDAAVAVLFLEQLAKQDPDHFAVADHAAGLFDAFGLWTGQQRTDDDWRAGQSASFGNEG